jgi:hypothetical protein
LGALPSPILDRRIYAISSAGPKWFNQRMSACLTTFTTLPVSN